MSIDLGKTDTVEFSVDLGGDPSADEGRALIEEIVNLARQSFTTRRQLGRQRAQCFQNRVNA